jgi:hypothetical protein
MPGIYKSPITKVDVFGRITNATKTPTDFIHLLNKHITDIISFDDTLYDVDYVDKIILPRHYYIFVGTKDSEVQYKPYEFNQYRIVVTTYKDIITSIDSIG